MKMKRCLGKERGHAIANNGRFLKMREAAKETSKFRLCLSINIHVHCLKISKGTPANVSM